MNFRTGTKILSFVCVLISSLYSDAFYGTIGTYTIYLILDDSELDFNKYFGPDRDSVTRKDSIDEPPQYIGGRYFYKKIGTRLKLNGNMVHDSILTLRETNDTGKIIGIFKLIYTPASISGTWNKPDSKKYLRVELTNLYKTNPVQEQYPEIPDFMLPDSLIRNDSCEFDNYIQYKKCKNKEEYKGNYANEFTIEYLKYPILSIHHSQKMNDKAFPGFMCHYLYNLSDNSSLNIYSQVKDSLKKEFTIYITEKIQQMHNWRKRIYSASDWIDIFNNDTSAFLEHFKFNSSLLSNQNGSENIWTINSEGTLMLSPACYHPLPGENENKPICWSLSLTSADIKKFFKKSSVLHNLTANAAPLDILDCWHFEKDISNLSTKQIKALSLVEIPEEELTWRWGLEEYCYMERENYSYVRTMRIDLNSATEGEVLNLT